jgi:hypothetical protein
MERRHGFGCIMALALLSLFSSVVGGADPEEIILPPNTLVTQTLAANSSLCYDIPIVENLQDGTIAYTMRLIVTKLPREDPRSTLDLYMSRNPYRLASKKYHDYSATTGDPWKIEFQDTAWSNVLWNACVYSSSLPITFTVQASVLTYGLFSSLLFSSLLSYSLLSSFSC